ncbi:hypothetical protein E2P81_ATG02315 [Venturia nashicola]|nr:hypothetical protein E2P81_ATG02315 [Venturia nashicola]
MYSTDIDGSTVNGQMSVLANLGGNFDFWWRWSETLPMDSRPVHGRTHAGNESRSSSRSGPADPVWLGEGELLCMVSMYGVYVWCLCLVSMYGVYVWCLCLVSMSGIYVWLLCMSMSGVHVWCPCMVMVWDGNPLRKASGAEGPDRPKIGSRTVSVQKA